MANCTKLMSYCNTNNNNIYMRALTAWYNNSALDTHCQVAFSSVKYLIIKKAI